MIPDSIKALLHSWRHLEKALHLLNRAEFHHPLDAGAVVPAAIKDHDFARCGQMSHIALDVHLRLFAFGGRRQRDHSKDPGTHAFRDRFNDPALAGTVSPLEDDDDFESFGDDPLLQFDEFAMQAGEFSIVGFPRQ